MKELLMSALFVAPFTINAGAIDCTPVVSAGQLDEDFVSVTVQNTIDSNKLLFVEVGDRRVENCVTDADPCCEAISGNEYVCEVPELAKSTYRVVAYLEREPRFNSPLEVVVGGMCRQGLTVDLGN